VVAKITRQPAAQPLGLDLTQPQPVSDPTRTDPPPRLDPRPPVPVRLVSDPLGARVEIAGKDVGVTPVDFPLDPTAQPVLAVFTKDGFEPAQANVSSSDAPQLSVQLKKKRGLGKRPGIKTER